MQPLGLFSSSLWFGKNARLPRSLVLSRTSLSFDGVALATEARHRDSQMRHQYFNRSWLIDLVLGGSITCTQGGTRAQPPCAEDATWRRHRNPDVATLRNPGVRKSLVILILGSLFRLVVSRPLGEDNLR